MSDSAKGTRQRRQPARPTARRAGGGADSRRGGSRGARCLDLARGARRLEPDCPRPGGARSVHPAAESRTPSAGGPVSSGEDESDPYLLVADGRYFLYTSGVPGMLNVPLATSTDFKSWSPVQDVLPVLPAWAAPGYTWAPDVHRFGST